MAMLLVQRELFGKVIKPIYMLRNYLSSTDLSHLIKSIPHNFGAYFVKRACGTNFNEF